MLPLVLCDHISFRTHLIYTIVSIMSYTARRLDQIQDHMRHLVGKFVSNFFKFLQNRCTVV